VIQIEPYVRRPVDEESQAPEPPSVTGGGFSTCDVQLGRSAGRFSCAPFRRNAWPLSEIAGPDGRLPGPATILCRLSVLWRMVVCWAIRRQRNIRGKGNPACASGTGQPQRFSRRRPRTYLGRPVLA
jgi:hypothetical protein